jgi:hypothetical protein
VINNHTRSTSLCGFYSRSVYCVVVAYVENVSEIYAASIFRVEVSSVCVCVRARACACVRDFVHQNSRVRARWLPCPLQKGR